MSSDLSIHWPAALQPGDLLAVVAPASPVAREPFRAGVRWLEEWGFRVRYGEEIFQDRPYETAADQQRSQHLIQTLADPEVRGVLCARGGYGSLRLLEHLNFAALTAYPKLFVGFSDVTNLLCTFYQRLNLVTFHGPTVAHLEALTPAARASLQAVLTAPDSLNLKFTGLMVLCPGQAQGPLLGGNLTTLCHLIGTPFAPQLAGHVLFLEDHNEARYRIDRLLHHLRLSGALQGVAAVVLGSFTRCGAVTPLLEIFRTALAPLQIPVLAGLPVGHQPDNHTLPIGAWALVDAEAGSLQIEG
ncbi:MAG: LD-carboxypeptidase [Desulfobacteraceae bacterium]